MLSGASELLGLSSTLGILEHLRHSIINYLERFLVLKSITERNSMSCAIARNPREELPLETNYRIICYLKQKSSECIVLKGKKS